MVVRFDYIKNMDGWYHIVYCNICSVPGRRGLRGWEYDQEYPWKYHLPEWRVCPNCRGQISRAGLVPLT